MPPNSMTVHRVFLLEVAACHQEQTLRPMVLISIQRLSTPPASAQMIGKGNVDTTTVDSGDPQQRLEQELCTDQFVIDQQDSLRLMLGLAKVRAAYGCGFSRAMLDQYGAGYATEETEGSGEDQPDTPR